MLLQVSAQKFLKRTLHPFKVAQLYPLKLHNCISLQTKEFQQQLAVTQFTQNMECVWELYTHLHVFLLQLNVTRLLGLHA